MSEPLTETTRHFIRAHRMDDVKSLALQAARYPDVDMTEAIVQIAGHQAAASKLPTWYRTENILYPCHLPLEQCSSELTAHYKATLVSGRRLVDLTGGFGIDCSFMATRFEQADYVERQETLCDLARHNFPLLGLNHIRIHHADSIGFLQTLDSADCIYLDPARRNMHGGKTVSIADCEPDVGQLESLLLSKAPCVLVKLSPMLDISLALQCLPHTAAVHIISVANECKEILLQLCPEHTEHIPLHCINLTAGSQQSFRFTREEEAESVCSYTAQPGHFLYEPNTSLLKAGAYRSIAARLGISKLHPNSHLYTSDELCPAFPGRIFEISGITSLNKKELKNQLGEHPKANLTVRNFPASVAELRKRFRISEGGDLYLFATTLADESKKLIICKKYQS